MIFNRNKEQSDSLANQNYFSSICKLFECTKSIDIRICVELYNGNRLIDIRGHTVPSESRDIQDID